MKTIVTVIGARPQFIKAAPVGLALQRQGIKEVLLHTGQHSDHNMSEVFFTELDLATPKYNLGIHGGRHGEMTGRMLAGIEAALLNERPDLVLVYGDTNSTLAGALAGAKLQIPVAHVEAGLRSFNRAMPEEINRVVTDHVSSFLFCPTTSAVEQLRREGIGARAYLVGDVMYDAMLRFREKARSCSTVVTRLGLSPESYAVVTLHRAENTDDGARLRALLEFLRHDAKKKLVFPLHPRTREAVTRFDLSLDGFLVTPPLGYLDMVALIDQSSSIYTDSGGLQKEAYFLQKPCVTLRDETEWVETVTHGWNRLWNKPSDAARRPIAEYGDGQAAEAVAKALARLLN
jgi:UDP-GlcNAc3NAcA epimerase